MFYFKDLNIPDGIANWLIPILIVMCCNLPFLIYFGCYRASLITATLLATLQLYAVIVNGIRYPL